MLVIGMTLTNNEAHWLAGLLEGEGSFLSGPPSQPNLPIIALEMCDLDVVERATRLMEIRYIHHGRRGEAMGWKPAYRIALKGSRAVLLMRSLWPLMGERRRAQIGRALASYHATKSHAGATGEACSVEGCVRRGVTRGMCKNDYERWRQSGGPVGSDALARPVASWLEDTEAERWWLAGLLEGEGSFVPCPG